MGTPRISDFTGPLTPDAILVFFNDCYNSFLIWDQLNPNAKLTEATKVLLAGIHLKEPSASRWWNGDRRELLNNFTLFQNTFMERFMHSNQQLDTLRRFCSISQGGRDYRDFEADLRFSRQIVKRVFTTDPITDNQYNQHLFCHADPALIAQVMAKETNADIIKMGTDELITYMIKEWDALQAIRMAEAAPGTGLGPADTYAGSPASSSVGPLGAQYMSSPSP